MAYEHKMNTGALWPNDDKQSDSHPDFRGDGNFNGIAVWLSGWKNKTRDGKPYVKVTMKAKEAPQRPEYDEDPPPPNGEDDYGQRDPFDL